MKWHRFVVGPVTFLAFAIPLVLPAPAGAQPSNPTGGTNQDEADAGAPPTAPAPPGVTTPTAPSTVAQPAPSAEPAEEEGTFTVHATRPADMQVFATESLQELRVGRVKSRYALNIFGDLSFGFASRSEGDLRRPDPAFAVGVFDLLFTADLASQLTATSEVSFQYEPHTPLAELERLHIRWHPSKLFFVEAGRFHTDLGYWNVAYHHGRWLQMTIERPRTIDLHGGLLPAHWIGVQAGTSIPVGSGQLNAVVAVGSARDPLGSSTHEAHGTAFTPVNGVQGKVELVGLPFRDLHVGVSGVYDKIPAEPAFVRPGLPDEALDEYVAGAHIAYPGSSLTLITEGYLIQHNDPKSHNSPEAGSKWRTYGVFGLLGYTIDRFTPYGRVEWVDSRRNSLLPDPFFVPEPASSHGPSVTLDLVEYVGGVRIDVSTWSALKFEYRLTTGVGTRRDDLPTPAIHTGTASWSFGI